MSSTGTSIISTDNFISQGWPLIAMEIHILQWIYMDFLLPWASNRNAATVYYI